MSFETLIGSTPFLQVLSAGWLGLTVLLALALLTRWGQSQPLRKCVFFSLIAHVLLATSAKTLPLDALIRPAAKSDSDSQQVIYISTIEAEAKAAEEQSADPLATEAAAAAKPWDQLPTDATPAMVAPDLERPAAPLDPLTAERTPVTASTPAPDASPDRASEDLAAQPVEQTAPPAAAATAVDPAASAAPAPSVATTEIKPGATASSTSLADSPERGSDAALSLASESRDPFAPASTAATEAAAAKSLLEQAIGAEGDTLLPPMTSLLSEKTAAVDRLPAGETKAPSIPIVPTAGQASIDAANFDGLPGASPSGLRQLSDPFTPGGGPLASGGGLEPIAGIGLPSATRPAVLAPIMAARRPREQPAEMPEVYKLRVDPHRTEVIEQLGGSDETEAAVRSALRWLADVQSPDGHWDAKQFGAGKERNIDGRDRGGAGAAADSGVTSLALLAFLGAGHSHQAGSYQETVAKGLNYLISKQAPNGNLSGGAQVYEFMYCHAMATFAISECYAMTRDPALETAVRRAINYTLYAQDRSGGSWRYQPGEPGDTSVLGWQLMALKSAELAGVPIPTSTRELMRRFLRSVANGRQGGLASYRPGELPTRSMTAESLVCRRFLDLPLGEAAKGEAFDFILAEMPGKGPTNDYFWYYATLAAHGEQGRVWERWNEALQGQLLKTQVTEGELTGSWEPQGVWGGHGGRVYSTAMATLCLEVYYRFLPLYKDPTQAAQAETPLRR